MNWIGKSLRRKEDARFITGAGNYVADLMPGIAHMRVVCSEHASAKIKSINTAKAAAYAGVLVVITSDNLAAAGIGGLPCAWPVKIRDGTKMTTSKHPVLAIKHILHVGDPVAVVMANSLEEADTAAQCIRIDCELRPSQTDLASSLAANAAIVHSGFASNQCFD